MVKNRATMVEISGGHSDIRPIGVVEKVIEILDLGGMLGENTGKLKGDERNFREKLKHYRKRTQLHSGSYSETAFRLALQELVNN